MTNYVPTGKPDDLTRYDARALRREFDLIAAGVSSKADVGSDSTVSSTVMLIESPATKTFTAETNKNFAPGQIVFLADLADPAGSNMTGTLVYYDKYVTGNMTVAVIAKTGSGTRSSWAIGVSNLSGVTLVNNTFSGHQNFSRATVASSASTSDIWNAAGNQIDFTGTATVTGFPAAPQPGASRELVCGAACSFTAGANMLIDGVTSGGTVTCAANDIVIVRAVSITQFRLTRERYDGKPQKDLTDNIVTVCINNGYGSTNTKIKRFTTVLTNIGTAITYVDSSTFGSSFTINEKGLYEIFYQENHFTAQFATFGVSLNSNQLTTNIDAVSVANRVMCARPSWDNAPPGGINALTRTMLLNPGDVLRPHHGAVAFNYSSDLTLFSIRKTTVG